MMKRTDAHKFVSVSPNISDGEVDYVVQRKRRIQKWLNSQGIDCELRDVPNVALLGSGGGERAAVGLLGSLMQLGQDNMLDGLLYMCGVSGSTWCMASLYKDPDWSEDGERAQEVLQTLGGPAVGFREAVKWLRARKKRDPHFSLTDVWAALVTSMFMKEMDRRFLSTEAHRDSTNPYPIYTAIELHQNRADNSKGVFFEMTPHGCGFCGLDAYVSTSYLRSEFADGVLTHKRPEIDMVLLQGICGSAIADGQRNSKEIWKRIWHFLTGNKAVNPVLTYRTGEDGQVNSDGETLWNMDVESWQKSSLAERRAFIETVSRELLLDPDTWAESWKDQSCACNGYGVRDHSFLQSSVFSDVCWVTWNIFPMLGKWNWGTTPNFLYQFKGSNLPSSLVEEDKVHLIDAGLRNNSPYPPALRPEREVDLIISLDFSAEDPFETLFSAKEYAKKLDLDFPKVPKRVGDDKDRPKDCYVFLSRHAKEPTVMHMPLFNLQNCTDEEGIVKMREEYGTFQRAYRADQLKQLLAKAQENMRNARQRILDQIKAAVVRRRARNVASVFPTVGSSAPKLGAKRSYPGDGGEDITPPSAKRAPPQGHAPQGFCLMPIGSSASPFGPTGMPCWHCGAQQSPVRMETPPPSAPAPPPPFPGYYMVPMGYPLAHSAP